MKNKDLDLESIWRPLGGRFGELLEVDLESSWRSSGTRLGCLLEVSWKSLGGLSEVSRRSLGRALEVAWKSSWHCILRYGCDDAEAFRSVRNPGGSKWILFGPGNLNESM